MITLHDCISLELKTILLRLIILNAHLRGRSMDTGAHEVVDYPSIDGLFGFQSFLCVFFLFRNTGSISNL